MDKDKSAAPASQHDASQSASFYVIVDADHSPEYVTKYRNTAQEHINDACEQGVEGAGKWKAIPVVELLPERSQSLLRAPISAANPLPPGCYCTPGKCAAPKPNWCRDTAKRDALAEPLVDSGDNCAVRTSRTASTDAATRSRAEGGNTHPVAPDFSHEYTQGYTVGHADGYASCERRTQAAARTQADAAKADTLNSEFEAWHAQNEDSNKCCHEAFRDGYCARSTTKEEKA